MAQVAYKKHQTKGNFLQLISQAKPNLLNI